MKINYITTFILSILIWNFATAQTSEKMSYQAVIQDATGNLLVNQQVGMKVSILQGSADGTSIYSQTLTPTTNDYGTVAVEIGGEEGFSAIDWSASSYFLKTEIDPTGGNSYSMSGTTQLVSVPFALHAKVADKISENDPQFAAWDKSTGVSVIESQITDLQNYLTDESDPIFSAWDKSFGIEVNESQITDFKSYLTVETDPTFASTFSITSPQDGDLLKYNSTSEKWERFSPEYSEADHIHSNASTSLSGFMSADDKVKLDGIEESAEVNVAYNWNASSGDAAILNKPSKIGHLTLDAKNKNITNLSEPEVASNLATKSYVDELENKINKLMEHAGLLVADNEGNYYKAVSIGDQVWMAENLRVTHYNNGDPIPTGLSISGWLNATSGSYAVYPNFAIGGLNSDEEVLDAYGALYNWFAVVDGRGVCPTGWHIPTDAEWTQLTDYIASINDVNIGDQLKFRRQINSPLGGEWASGMHPRWNEDDTYYGTDDYDFSAIPSGAREDNGAWSLLGYHASLWTSSEYSSTEAWYRNMRNFQGNISRVHTKKQNGFSVRCLQD